MTVGNKGMHFNVKTENSCWGCLRLRTYAIRVDWETVIRNTMTYDRLIADGGDLENMYSPVVMLGYSTRDLQVL